MVFASYGPTLAFMLICQLYVSFFCTLGDLGVPLGHPWVPFVHRWGTPGSICKPFWHPWVPFGHHLGALGLHLDPFGQSGLPLSHHLEHSRVLWLLLAVTWFSLRCIWVYHGLRLAFLRLSVCSGFTLDSILQTHVAQVQALRPKLPIQRMLGLG